MRDWPGGREPGAARRPGGDVAEVRPEELAAASAVVVRFRRRRRAAVAAALSVAVAGTLSSRMLHDPASTSLVPATDAPVTAGPFDVPASPEPSPSVTAAPGDPAPGGTGTGGGPAGRPGAAPATPAPAAPGEPPRPAPYRPTRVGVVREPGGTRPYCGINAIPTRPMLCLGARGIQEKKGSAVSLRYTACQAEPSFATESLTFRTTQEVDYVVVKDGRTVWRWSRGQRFAASPHTVAVATGSCVEWRTLWNGRLDDGTRVRSGQYQLRAAGRDTEGKLVYRTATFSVRY